MTNVCFSPREGDQSSRSPAGTVFYQENIDEKHLSPIEKSVYTC
jgi:hypothetical protein